jgi:hypothetical protein
MAKKTKREIIQIAATPDVEMGGLWIRGKVIALCNDGTVWQNVNNSEWAKLPEIPQD